ncbi:putative methyltransferase YcgJ [Myxococcaceae bacterium]|nr:putative methyltransferase YcgJ [Myxococcaceae bacterium]
MRHAESIRRQFSAASAAYAVSAVHRGGPDLDALIAAAGEIRGRRVLDVGAGAGATALAFVERGAEVTALDATPAMLETLATEATRRGLVPPSARIGDAAALPFEDAAFDLVTCRVCAHHFADVRAAIAEMARVLRPGGLLLVEDSISYEDDVQDTWLNAIELLRDPSHVRNHAVSEWLAMLAAAGLDARHLSTFGVRLEFDDWTARMNVAPADRERLLALLVSAPVEVRDALEIGAGGDWTIPLALFCARKSERRGSCSGERADDQPSSRSLRNG